jgi:hypothetical protein
LQAELWVQGSSSGNLSDIMNGSQWRVYFCKQEYEQGSSNKLHAHEAMFVPCIQWYVAIGQSPFASLANSTEKLTGGAEERFSQHKCI